MERRIFRWYSKNFSTPLHEVADLPLEDVLQAYYEDTYERLDKDQIEPIRARLAETDDDRLRRLEEEEENAEDDDAWIKEMEEEELKRIAKLSPKPVAADPQASRPRQLSNRATAAEAPLPDTAPPPDMVMTFLSLEEMDAKLSALDE